MGQLARGADLRERLLCIIVEGDGVPQCALTTWGNSKQTLAKALYGDQTSLADAEYYEELNARWKIFSNLDDWSVDANGQPFGLARRMSCEGLTIQAFFVTYPDVITMRRL